MTAGVYQEMLTDAGGMNPFGEANYRLAWGPNEALRISTGSSYRDYTVCADPCWVLMKWESAEWWGSRYAWERDNWEPNGLYTAGVYPAHGRYRMVRKMQFKFATVRGGELKIETIPLNGAMISQLFPLLRDFEQLSAQQKQRLVAERENERKERATQEFVKKRTDYRISRSSVLVKEREEKLERWARNPENIRREMRARSN